MRKDGLIFPTMKAEIETVRPGHKKGCYICGRLPIGMRLVVTVGSARASETQVFCIEHANTWTNRRIKELHNTLHYLHAGAGCIREKVQRGDPSYKRVQWPKNWPKERKPEDPYLIGIRDYHAGRDRAYNPYLGVDGLPERPGNEWDDGWMFAFRVRSH